MFDQAPPEKLARKHLDRLFDQARVDSLRRRPPKGWIRAIRDALGLTVRQLAVRMGKTHSVLLRLERSETADTISLASLRAAAEAMDCQLVYAIIPNRRLEEIAERRARAQAGAHLARVNHSMGLEDQALTPEDLAEEQERLTADILNRGGSALWRDM